MGMGHPFLVSRSDWRARVVTGAARSVVHASTTQTNTRESSAKSHALLGVPQGMCMNASHLRSSTKQIYPVNFQDILSVLVKDADIIEYSLNIS